MSIRGMTLIETLFSVAIFLIIVLGIFQAYRALQLSIGASEQKLFALELVNGRIELGRSVGFVDLDSLVGTEIISRAGRDFTLDTLVVGVDDFKLLEAKVSCIECRNFSPITLTGRFAP